MPKENIKQRSYVQVVSPDESRLLSPPVGLVPESPEQNALHRRVPVQSFQCLLVEVRSSVLVLRLNIQLRHPDGHSCLSQQVQPLLRTKGLIVYITPSPRWTLLPEPASPAVAENKRVNCLYNSVTQMDTPA